MTIVEIPPHEAHERLHEFDVVDVRADHEFHGPLGRVPGSRLLPLPELAARAGELPLDRPLLLVCRSGMRSLRACEALEALARGPVANLTGGMIAWNRAKLPVESTKPTDRTELRRIMAAWLAQVSPGKVENLGLARIPATYADLSRALDRIESSLGGDAAPADLELSLAAFRRWLAGS